MNRKELDRIRMLPVLGIVLAVFLSFGISVFATEDGVGDIPAEGEVIEAEVETEESVIKPNDLADSDELLDDYIEVITEEYAKTDTVISFEAKNGIIADKLRGSKLPEAEKKAYNILKTRIMEEVATGENDGGLTYFSIEFGDIYPDEVLNARYSAEELGVEEVVYYDDSDGEYKFTEEAKDAVSAKYTLDTGKILSALLYDCPYAMFWFDKTAGMFTRTHNWVAGDVIDNEVKAYCDLESTYTFYFAVSTDYVPTQYYVEEFNGVVRPIQTDTQKIKGLNSIAENAAAVVQEAAANFENDYDKLDYYKDWICSQVEYDNYAAKKENNVSYGDPWQLIFVFDGNEDTNAIVCEGYSKAFKYLCDLTNTFDDNTIDCRLATGDMDGGTGAGAHMWNLVEINNANYLVDVTNCDEGTVGHEDYLFMRGDEAQNPSGYTIHIPAREYYSEANIEYVYDDDTISAFEADELCLASIDYTYDPPCAHDYREVPGSAEEPTCTKAGKDADQKCSICQNLKEGKAIPALDHDWKEATCTTPKTCERCKATEGEALDHDWKDATCTAPKICERCKETEGEALGHDWKDATCTTPKTCEHCKVTEGDALGHKWDEGVVTTAPTVNDQGVRTYTCTVCNIQKDASIAKLPKPVAVPAGKALTYNAKAQTGVASGEGYTLSGMSATNAGSYTATAKLKSGYIWKDGTTAAKKISWKINKLAISKATMSGIAGKVYTGKAIAQSPTLKFAGRTLKKGTDYKLSYKNNLKVGRASVTISGYGNFSGSVTKTFNINPKGASLKTPAALKKGMTVYWNRQTAKMSTARITGYQVQIATDANFKKNVKTYTVKGYNSASRKITGLKGKTKYYVRIRTYQTLKISGKNTNFFSGWSAKKAVTTKN